MADNLYLSALRTQSLPFRIEEYMDFIILNIAEKTIVKAIRDQAIRKKMPQRYIDNIHSEFDGTYLWIWVDFKGKKNNEPLDVFFEEGTKRHKIRPTRKKALAFTLYGATGIISAFTAFSLGHWVKGIRARHVFRQGFKKGYPRFKKLLQKELESTIKRTKLFG